MVVRVKYQNARNTKAGQGTNLTGLRKKTSESAPGVSRALWKKLVDGSPYWGPFARERVLCLSHLEGGHAMSQLEMFEKPDGEGEVIYRMTITTKSGKVIRRANGQPFRIVIRPKATS